ncbi:MAG: hypothetical protein WD751_03335 [Anaerolineales bacterium]
MTNPRVLIYGIFVIALLLAACGPGTPASPTATTEPTSEPTSAPAIGAGLCANAYYPVLVGATHTYAGTSFDGSAYSFTDTITDVRADGFTLTSEFEGLTRTQEWECASEGLIALQYESGASAGISANGLSGEFQTTGASGVTLPANVAPGDTWSQAFTITGNLDMGEAGEATAAGDVAISYTAIGVEEVSTAAGTFTALRVESHLTFNLTATFQGLEIPIAFEADTVSWYGQGIGWVKSEDSSTIEGTGSFSTTLDLQSFSIP